MNATRCCSNVPSPIHSFDSAYSIFNEEEYFNTSLRGPGLQIFNIEAESLRYHSKLCIMHKKMSAAEEEAIIRGICDSQRYGGVKAVRDDLLT